MQRRVLATRHGVDKQVTKRVRRLRSRSICIDKRDTSIILTDFSFSGYLSPYLDTDCNDGYSPLEQYEKNTRLDLSADVYSVGAVFYEMISEKPTSAVHGVKADTLVAPTLIA